MLREKIPNGNSPISQVLIEEAYKLSCSIRIEKDGIMEPLNVRCMHVSTFRVKMTIYSERGNLEEEK